MTSPPVIGELWNQPRLPPDDRRARRWLRWTWIPVALLIAGPTWGGYMLGDRAATSIVLAQVAAADRAAASVPMPELPKPLFYPQRTPVPMPSVASPAAAIGEPFAAGESVVFRQMGLPIEFAVPRAATVTCTILSAPGAGSATAYEWECDWEATGSPYAGSKLRILLATCTGGCGEAERAQLRPAFAARPLTASDATTWYAVGSRPTDFFGQAWYELVMEHVWAAPAAVLAPGQPPQNLYVAVTVLVTTADTAVARKLVNALRART